MNTDVDTQTSASNDALPLLAADFKGDICTFCSLHFLTARNDFYHHRCCVVEEVKRQLCCDSLNLSCDLQYFGN